MNALSALDVLRMKTDKAPLENAVVLFADYELEARQDGRNIIASLAAAELAAKDAELAALRQERDELKRSQAQEVDEFNAGYQAFQEGLDVTSAEIEYRGALPDEVPSYDVFRIGYAWAKECAALARVDGEKGQ